MVDAIDVVGFEPRELAQDVRYAARREPPTFTGFPHFELETSCSEQQEAARLEHAPQLAHRAHRVVHAVEHAEEEQPVNGGICVGDSFDREGQIAAWPPVRRQVPADEVRAVGMIAGSDVHHERRRLEARGERWQESLF